MSYWNLDKSGFDYVFPGELILINDDKELVIQSGSESEDVWFRVEYPCALNLTMTHSTTSSSL